MLKYNAKTDAIVIGDACVDIIVPFPKFLNEEHTEVEFTNPEIRGGGTCANTAVALAKLGVPTSFMGTIGNDNYGRLVTDEFHTYGINTDLTLVDDEKDTVGVFAFIDERHERHLWAWPRGNEAYTHLDLSKIDMDRVRNASWVHSSGMTVLFQGSMRKNIVEVFKAAREAGVPTSFDLNTRVSDPEHLKPEIRETVLEILEYCDYMLGSGKDEFYSFCPQADWRESARHFVTDKRTVIARMGKDGALGMSVTETVEEKPFDVPVVDTVGAGDVFNAGFIAARLAGKSLGDSIICGNGVSSFKVSGPSGRHTPTAEQLDSFLQGFHVTL